MWVCKIFGHKFREAPLRWWLNERIKYMCSVLGARRQQKPWKKLGGSIGIKGNNPILRVRKWTN